MKVARPIIYLIGGAAGAGKTTVAAMLAQELGISWLQADSTWLALKSITTMESHPELRFFPELVGTVMDYETDYDHFARQFRHACAVVGRALEAGIDQEVEGRPAGYVIEGTWLPPEWMASVRRTTANADIRGILVHEADGEHVLTAIMTRSGGMEATPEQRQFADLSWRIGQELRLEAVTHDIPVVAARPRATLLRRAMVAFEVPPPGSAG